MITQQQLHDLFKYENGYLYWKKKLNIFYNKKNDCKAGVSLKNGYVRIQVLNKNYLAHRIIYCMFYGYFPKLVDHIDGNKSNNKIENLREATVSENHQNKKMSKNNTSGYPGVTWHTSRKKWIARVGHNGKCLQIGYFDDKHIAYQEYKKLKQKLHPNTNWDLLPK